jgi:hypothetical protein
MEPGACCRWIKSYGPACDRAAAVLYGDDCPEGSQSLPPASSLSSGDFTIAVGSIGPIGPAFPGTVAVPIVVA